MRDRSYVLVNPATGEVFRETRIGSDRRSSLLPTDEEMARAVVRYAGAPRMAVTFPIEDLAFGPDWLAFMAGQPTVDFLPQVTVDISVNPSTINLGQSATLTWTSQNATALVASGAWSGPRPANGTEVVTPSAAGSLTYTITASGSGEPASDSVGLTVANPLPQVRFLSATSSSPTASVQRINQSVTASNSSAQALVTAGPGAVVSGGPTFPISFAANQSLGNLQVSLSGPTYAFVSNPEQSPNVFSTASGARIAAGGNFGLGITGIPTLGVAPSARRSLLAYFQRASLLPETVSFNIRHTTSGNPAAKTRASMHMISCRPNAAWNARADLYESSSTNNLLIEEFVQTVVGAGTLNHSVNNDPSGSALFIAMAGACAHAVNEPSLTTWTTPAGFVPASPESGVGKRSHAFYLTRPLGQPDLPAPANFNHTTTRNLHCGVSAGVFVRPVTRAGQPNVTAISFVGASESVDSGIITSVSCAKPSGTMDDDLVIIFLSVQDALVEYSAELTSAGTLGSIGSPAASDFTIPYGSGL